MFTACIFMYASLFATQHTSANCRENLTNADIIHIRYECAMVAKDPLTTCEMVKVSDDKYAVYIRKLDGV